MVFLLARSAGPAPFVAHISLLAVVLRRLCLVFPGDKSAEEEEEEEEEDEEDNDDPEPPQPISMSPAAAIASANALALATELVPLSKGSIAEATSGK